MTLLITSTARNGSYVFGASGALSTGREWTQTDTQTDGGTPPPWALCCALYQCRVNIKANVSRHAGRGGVCGGRAGLEESSSEPQRPASLPARPDPRLASLTCLLLPQCWVLAASKQTLAPLVFSPLILQTLSEQLPLVAR